MQIYNRNGSYMVTASSAMLFVYCTVCVTVNTNDFHLAIWFRALVIQIKYKLSMIERPMWRFHRKSSVSSINIFLRRKIVGIFSIYLSSTHMSLQWQANICINCFSTIECTWASAPPAFSINMWVYRCTATLLHICELISVICWRCWSELERRKSDGMAWHGMVCHINSSTNTSFSIYVQRYKL